ncbi:MAG TPA: helix-turn-helix domain-containing protein [Pirellulales bacterium]|nr:helix-turn-helix domain-containing protein [Pirellulales bacterium]
MATVEAMDRTNRGGLRNVAEVAAYLGVSRSKVYLLMDAGELRWVKIGKSRRVRWEDVERMIERNTHGTAE